MRGGMDGPELPTVIIWVLHDPHRVSFADDVCNAVPQIHHRESELAQITPLPLMGIRRGEGWGLVDSFFFRLF
jgi:hypothetical protein